MSVDILIRSIPHRATLTPDNVLVISDASGFGGPGYHNRAYQFFKNSDLRLQFQLDDSRGWSGMASHVREAIALAERVMGANFEPLPDDMNARLELERKGRRLKPEA